MKQTKLVYRILVTDGTETIDARLAPGKEPTERPRGALQMAIDATSRLVGLVGMD